MAVRRSVTLGLFLAWLANDAEEWFTMAPWTQANPDRTPPWMREPMSQEHARTAISLMGLVVLAASVRGARTGGRSPFFQSALFGFGAHGVGHLAATALHGGYTPGVATAPTVVIPYSLWAWRELGRAGVRRDDSRSWLSGVLMIPVSLAAVHGAARLITRWRKTG
ncbi:Protein of unknown function with HXXEE motif-containing protein [Saccharopolyspora kobensis]|uniref:HXXEE domain-containing protein n=1 Tax=Saccharopolyspora kobensis TaxID=146035 RepID=A0A1H6D2P7_9PSEU|nr:HXXEE domain-containing protein [Saccharopolyspora kobensis]SEG79557.1 Protein of unknown function with HXXEE motif-containing protein [Saccharopolyspora kobensis]SFD08693.1 Protein of unknown function with HXXEE motif-containing protein [Saccharopolyspora kobensis]